MKLSRTMRNELIEYKDKWQFEAGLADFENPPLLHFLLEQILFGTHSKHVTGRRMDDCYKMVDVLSQVILQNVKTDRQIKLKPMTDTGFRQRAETPVSIGLPVSLHSRVRDNSLVNLISDMHLGSSYDSAFSALRRSCRAAAADFFVAPPPPTFWSALRRRSISKSQFSAGQCYKYLDRHGLPYLVS